MNKLAHGIAMLGLLVVSTFAADSYYIFSGSNVVAWGTNNYVFGYTYGTVTLDNPQNPFSTGTADYVNEGVGKIINATVPTSSGVFIGVKANVGTATKSITDCAQGFSYWYKGSAHEFNLQYSESSCTGTGEKWNNKWRASAPAVTEWTKKSVALTGFAQVTGGPCNVSISQANLGIVEQLVWGTEGGTTGVSSYNLMIGNVACLGTGTSISGDVAPTANFTWVAGAEDICTGYYCNWTNPNGGSTDCGLISTDKSGTGGTVTATCAAAISNCAINSPSKKVYSNSTCTTPISVSSSSTNTQQSSSSNGTQTQQSSSSVNTQQSSSSNGMQTQQSSSSNGMQLSSSSNYTNPIISHNNAPVSGLNVTHFARSLQIASGKDATVALFDMHGKQVFSQKILSGTTTINLEKQRQGIYYAVVKSGLHKQTVKVVLK